MKLDTTVHDHHTFVNKVLHLVQQTALKKSQVSDTEELLCTDGKFVLLRKLTSLARRGDRGKLAFFHGFDVLTLFKDIIRDTVLSFYLPDYTVDLFLIADPCEEVATQLIDLLASKQSRVFICPTMTSLLSKINAGKSEKKLIFNFDRTAHYIECDLFLYFGMNLNPSEMRRMFKLSMLDSIGKFVIIDTVPQRIQKQTTFLTRDHNRLRVQHELAYVTLKNCPVAGKTVSDMISRIIFDTQTNRPAPLLDPDSEDEEEGEADTLRTLISEQLAVFVDRETDNYLLQFMREHIGNVKVLNTIAQAWLTLTECTKPFKLVCFMYIRTIPDFRDLSLFCNAYKQLHPEGKELIVLVLVSPSLEKATADSLRQYKDDFNVLLDLATSTSCCSGLHCEETLLRQYLIPNDCGCSGTEAPVQHAEATQVISAIFDAISLFVRNRAINFNPVFHEQDLLTAVQTQVESDLSSDLVASFLYRSIPFTSKDGLVKVVVPFFDRPGLFIVKPDYQKYIHVATLTGIDFNSSVHDLLEGLYEEYQRQDI